MPLVTLTTGSSYRSCWNLIIPSLELFFFFIALLKFNLYTRKFAHCKCTNQKFFRKFIDLKQVYNLSIQSIQTQSKYNSNSDHPKRWPLFQLLCLVVSLCNPMDCSPPGSSVHGISQARILEWVAVSSSRGSS